MGLDHIVNLSCKPKLFFGGGDFVRGTRNILSRIKAKNQAELLATVSGKKGDDLDEMMVSVASADGHEREASYAELMTEAAPLSTQAGPCAKCPANVVGRPYGCFGAAAYPIEADSESWLIARVAGAGEDANELMFSAIDELEYTGGPIAEFRGDGIFQNPEALSIDLGGRTVTSDQILHAILAAGAELEAHHCFMLLVWVGAVELSDARADTVDLGETPEALGALEFFALFSAMAAAVACDVSLIIDA